MMTARVVLLLVALCGAWLAAAVEFNKADPCMVVKYEPYTDMCGNYFAGESNTIDKSLYQSYNVWNDNPFNTQNDNTYKASNGYFPGKFINQDMCATNPNLCPMRNTDVINQCSSRVRPESSQTVQTLRDTAKDLDYEPELFAANWTKGDAASYLNYNYGEFGAGNDPPFCLRVENTLNRKVQIIIETESDDMRVCVRNNNQQTSQDDPSAVQQCGSGQFKACFLADVDTRCSETSSRADCMQVGASARAMNLYFYCDGNCAEQAETAFYFKVQVSASPYNHGEYNAMNDGLEMWCSIINDGRQCEEGSDAADQPQDANSTSYCDSSSYQQKMKLESMFPSQLLSEAKPNPVFEIERGVTGVGNPASANAPSSLLIIALCAIVVVFVTAVAPSHP